MSKVTIALASFVAGVVLTASLVLSGSHASILAQAPSSHPPSAPQDATPKLGPVFAGGAGLPIVPPISQHMKGIQVVNINAPFGVDGTECDRCTFIGLPLRYGGGNFQFTNFKFSGPLRVEFVGAARNTLIFLDFIQRLEAGQQPIRPKAPSPEIVRNEIVKTEMTGTFGIPH